MNVATPLIVPTACRQRHVSVPPDGFGADREGHGRRDAAGDGHAAVLDRDLNVGREWQARWTAEPGPATNASVAGDTAKAVPFTEGTGVVEIAVSM